MLVASLLRVAARPKSVAPRPQGRAFAALALAVVLACGARTAKAASEDGAYGRLAGDVTFVAGAGGAYVPTAKRGLLTADLRARFFDAAGVVVQYEEGELKSVGTRGDVQRNVVALVEFRPLFPIRFLKNWESGRAFSDLVLDSFGLEMGAFWSVRAEDPVRRAGLAVGLSMEAPLAGAADGPWVHLGWSARWSAERLEGSVDPGGRYALFQIGLAWHYVAGTHLVDAGDRDVE